MKIRVIFLFVLPLCSMMVYAYHTGALLITPSMIVPHCVRAVDNQMQVRVPNQFTMPAGEASCGYQALYNGLALVDFVRSSEADRSAQLNKVTLPEARLPLFGSSDTEWRKIVGAKRAEKLAKDPILEKLMEQVRGKRRILLNQKKRPSGQLQYTFNNDCYVQFDGLEQQWQQDELDALMKFLTNVARTLSEKEHRKVGHDLVYRLSRKEIEKAIHDEIPKESESQGVYSRLKKSNIIARYIRVSDIACVMPLDPGDWLAGDEIDKLIKHLHRHNVFIVGDSMSASARLSESPLVFTNEKLTNFISAFQNPQGNALGAFIIYTKDPSLTDSLLSPFKKTPETEAEMIQEEMESNDRGHWFTLVANKVGNQRQYILADSADNRVRIDDPRVLDVIELLEGEDSEESSQEMQGDSQVAIAVQQIQIQGASSQPAPLVKTLKMRSTRIRLAQSYWTAPKAFCAGVCAGALSYAAYIRWFNQTVDKSTQQDSTPAPTHDFRFLI